MWPGARGAACWTDRSSDDTGQQRIATHESARDDHPGAAGVSRSRLVVVVQMVCAGPSAQLLVRLVAASRPSGAARAPRPRQRDSTATAMPPNVAKARHVSGAQFTFPPHRFGPPPGSPHSASGSTVVLQLHGPTITTGLARRVWTFFDRDGAILHWHRVTQRIDVGTVGLVLAAAADVIQRPRQIARHRHLVTRRSRPSRSCRLWRGSWSS